MSIKRHGMSHTPLHDIWCGMNDRCNPNHVHAERYGKRGISVCTEWAIFENFQNWALENGYRDGLTIERIDVDGNYSPENCKWIPLSEQARNRRTTRWVVYQGKKMSLAEASEIAKLPYKQVHFRIKCGWSVEKALSEPVKDNSNSLRRKCKEMGMNYNTVYNRVYSLGWSVEKALSTPIKRKGCKSSKL